MIEIFNYRKQMFDYGVTEIYNRGNPIQSEQLQSKHFKMTSREMATFIHFFPLIIGDLVPQEHCVWIFLCSLVDIIDLLHFPYFNNTDLVRLECLITQHNRMYQRLFSQTLKPKHHFLVHYVTAIKMSGPLKYLWSIRFEAKHQQLKCFAKNTNSRKNIAFTLAMKSSLKFASFILKGNVISPEYQFSENESQIEELKTKIYFTMLQHNDILQIDLPIYFNSECIYKGKIYKKGYLVAHANLLTLNLYEIIECLLVKNSIYLTVQHYETKEIDRHFRAYEIQTKLDIFSIFSISMFTSPPLHSCILPSGKRFIRNKFFYK